MTDHGGQAPRPRRHHFHSANHLRKRASGNGSGMWFGIFLLRLIRSVILSNRPPPMRQYCSDIEQYRKANGNEKECFKNSSLNVCTVSSSKCDNWERTSVANSEPNLKMVNSCPTATNLTWKWNRTASHL